MSLEFLKILNHYNEFEICLTNSYLLLKTNQFQKAYTKLKNHFLKPSNFTDPYLLVNYFIASKKLKKNVRPEKVKDKLLNGVVHNDLISAAAYAIIDDQNNAYKKLSDVIKKDKSRKYTIKDWIVFEDIFKVEKFQKLLI